MMKEEGAFLREELKKKNKLIKETLDTSNKNICEVSNDFGKLQEEHRQLNERVAFLAQRVDFLEDDSTPPEIDDRFITSRTRSRKANRRNSSMSSTTSNTDYNNHSPRDIDDRFITSRTRVRKEKIKHLSSSSHDQTNVCGSPTLVDEQFLVFRDTFLLIGLEIGRLKDNEKEMQRQQQLQTIKKEKHQRFLQHQDNMKIEAAIQESAKSQTQSSANEENRDERNLLQHVGNWINCSNDFARNTMIKWGYGGGGLGKNGDGIKEPIAASKTHFASKVEPPPWPKNTVLIAGSSMINSLDETRMSRKFNVKVRSNNGATSIDMVDHLNAFLRKKPDHLIFHVGTNDASSKDVTSEILYARLLRLKSFAEFRVPGLNVVISCPTVRTDNLAANRKILELRKKLISEGVNIISNENISAAHLGKKGLHLNKHGVSRLAMNLIACIKGL